MPTEYKPNETGKTLLLIIASAFVAKGVILLETDLWTGVVITLIGGVIFVVRGYLKAKKVI